MARRQNGLDVYNGTLQEYDEKCKFDVITFINVLDHSVEPWKEIKKIYGLLKPRGIVYFRFPNGFLHIQTYRLSSKCGFADLIQKYLVFHEFSFTPRFVRRLLSDYGYADIEVYNANLSGERSERFSPIFSFISRSIEVVRKLTDLVTRGRILWGPSLEVIARKK